MNSIDFDNFAVERQKIKSWWGNHFRLHFKIHDPLGFFGAERFDYFCYGNKQEIETNGISKTSVLLHTEKSLTRLPGNRYREVKERMADFGIDTEEVINGNELIFAYDKLNRLMIGKSSLTILFPPFVKQNNQQLHQNQSHQKEREDKESHEAGNHEAGNHETKDHKAEKENGDG